MYRRIILCVSCLVVSLVLSGPAAAFIRDVRIEQLEILRTDPATLRTPAGQRQWSRADARLDDFKGAYGQGWRVRWNELTGTPHRMFGGQITAPQLDPSIPANTRLKRNDILQLAEQFTRQHQELLRVRWDDLQLAYADFRGGRWVVTLKQMSSGIEIVGGRVDLRFSASGTLMMIGADIYPVRHSKSQPRLSARRAWQSAVQNLPNVLGQATEQAELVYLPMMADEPRNMGVRLAAPRQQVGLGDLRVRAAYRVRVRTADPLGDWETYVDAATGTILSRENRLHFVVSGSVQGDVRPLLGTDTPVIAMFPDQSVFGGAMVDTVASYDFESGAAGWSSQSPWTLSGESVNSGFNAWSDSPGGNYANNLNLLLTSPTLDISSTSDPVLSFYVRFELEDTWDFLYVEASGDNGATWQILDVLNGLGVAWHEERVDLQPVAGTANLKVRFRLFTDGAVVESGCWIDDVTIASLGSAHSDANGNYSLAPSGGSNAIAGRMMGRYTRIGNRGGPDASILGTAVSDTFNLVWSDSNSSSAERDVYKALSNVHDRMKQIDPNFTDLDYPLPVYVGVSFCNAYWAGSQIVMGSGSAGCANLGNWMPVVYHEYGHGVTDHIYDVVANPPSDMNEAFSDYIAATITGDPRVGPDILGPGAMFRNIENKLRTPEDIAGQVHHDGSILAAALWDMRRNLAPDVALSDSLFHFARFGFPTSFEDYFLEVLSIDDDDANLGNGTPHITEIQSAFGEHGIGLGPEFQHVDVVVQDVAGNNDGRLDPGETADLQLTLRNYGAAQSNVYVRLLSTVPGVTVLSDSIFIGAVGADTDITAGTSFTVQVSDTVVVGTALTFDLDIHSSDGFNGDCFMLPAGYVAILLVDDDRYTTQEAWFQDSLDRIGKAWTRWEAGSLGSPPAEIMAQYRAVIWHTGNDSRTTLTAGDQEELTAYLGGGGNLFLTGEDIGFDIWNNGAAADIAFYETWLRAQVDVQDEGAPAVVGEVADVIGNGLSFSLNGGSSAGNQASVSSLLPQAGAVVSLRYPSGRVAALRYDGAYRLFYCGFGFEGIDTVANRDTLMSRAMAWLCPAEINNPNVTVTTPNGGETLIGNTITTIGWTATDDIAVLLVDILLSTDNGANYNLVASGVPNTYSYDWTVDEVSSSTCLIRVEATDPSSNVGFDVSDAVFEITASTNATTQIPRFALYPATPNPFNPMTTLRFDLPRSARVWLEVWSIDGRHVRTLVGGQQLAAGSVQRVWNGRDDAGRPVASGVYLVRMRAADFAQSQKVQLLK